MKITLKRTLLLVLSVLLIASLSLFLLDTGKTRKTYADSEITVETGEFEVLDKASVRIATGQTEVSGLKWTVRVKNTFHNELAGLGQVEYHLLVDNKEITSYDGQTVVDIPCTDTPEFVGGYWEYTCAITYEKTLNKLMEKYGPESAYGYTEDYIKDNLLPKVYKTELYVKGYVKVVPATGDPQHGYSLVGDTTRSVRGVAIANLLAGEYTSEDDAYESLVKFAGGELSRLDSTAEKLKSAQIKNLYSELDGEGAVVSSANVPAGTYDIFVGGKKVGSQTFDGNTKANINFTNIAKNPENYGKDVEMNFVNSSNQVYTIPFRYATKVIDDLADFSVVTYKSGKAIDGYYIMKNNIQAAAGSIYSGVEAWRPPTQKEGFVGTFDGNGYAVIYAKLWYGIFGTIYDGTIKNLAIYHCISGSANSAGTCTLAKFILGDTVIDNCYFYNDRSKGYDFASIDASRTVGAVSNYIAPTVKMSNSVIEVRTYTTNFAGSNYGIIANTHMVGANFQYIKQSENEKPFDWQMENVYYINVDGQDKVVNLVNTSGTLIGAVYGENQQSAYDACELAEDKKFIVEGLYFYPNYYTFGVESSTLASFDKNVWNFWTSGTSNYRAPSFINADRLTSIK